MNYNFFLKSCCILFFILVAFICYLYISKWRHKKEQSGGYLDIVSYSIPRGVASSGGHATEYVMSLENQKRWEEGNRSPPIEYNKSNVVQVDFKESTNDQIKSKTRVQSPFDKAL